MSKRNSEGDVLANKANVMLANKHRLLASLLGPKTDAELKAEKTNEEKEEDDFKDENLGHEQLGIGGKIPKDILDGSFTRRTMNSNDKLLEQLIGKKAAKAHIAAKQAPQTNAKNLPLGKRSRTFKPEESEEEEEEGRTAAFMSKRPKTTKVPNVKREDVALESEQDRSDKDVEQSTLNTTAQNVLDVDGREKEDHKSPKSRSQKPRSGSYLDEILAERSKKKKNKKTK